MFNLTKSQRKKQLMDHLLHDTEPDFKELSFARARQIEQETKRLIKLLTSDPSNEKAHKGLANYYKSVLADIQAIKRYIQTHQQQKLEL